MLFQRGFLMLKNNYWKYINIYRKEIMGFAALIITVMHLYVSFYEDAQIPYITTLLKRGNLGVDIFLLLSGCGLFYSMEKSSDIVNFYRKRMARVLIPYLVLSFPYWILLDLYVNNDMIQLVKDISLASFWLQGITHYWFVAFILPVYLFYPWIYQLQKKNSNYIILLGFVIVMLTGLLMIFDVSYYEQVEIAITRIPVFLMGSYLGECLRNGDKSRAKIWVFNLYFVTSFILFIMSVVFVLFGKNRLLADVFYRYGSGGAGLFLIFIVSFILIKNEQSFFASILRYFGTITLEIYIVSQSIRNGILVLGLGTELSIAFKLLIETGVFVLSTILSKVYKRI